MFALNCWRCYLPLLEVTTEIRALLSGAKVNRVRAARASSWQLITRPDSARKVESATPRPQLYAIRYCRRASRS